MRELWWVDTFNAYIESRKQGRESPNKTDDGESQAQSSSRIARSSSDVFPFLKEFGVTLMTCREALGDLTVASMMNVQ